jgi:hypothetical protein
MCLAVIDQFLATCSHPRWHQWNNMKVARFMVIGTVILWILHGIPFLIYYNHILSPITGEVDCVITNTIFQKYSTICFSAFIASTLPISIMILFGILAYRNVQQIAYRTVPLVRRELDKQLTTMVLVQVFFDIFAVTPLIIYSISSLIISTPNNLLTLTELNFISKITTILYYFYFVVGIIHLI